MELIRQTLRATLPLLIWAAHFALCYVLVGVQCSPAFITPSMPQRWLLGGVSVLALAACAALLWRARGVIATAGEGAPLRTWAAAGGALLALAGVAWTSVPLLLLGGCG